MNLLPKHVRQSLIEFIPQSDISRVSCFVFYDDHPRDSRLLDVTVCSDEGEVKEFYQRELVNSILIENINKVTDISIVRNSNSDLYYMVAAEDELIILSKKNALVVHERITNVESYKFEESNLKVIRSDDAIPLMYNENFIKLEHSELSDQNNSEDSLPVVNELMRKLNEVKYNTKHNENILQEYKKLRELAAWQMYKSVQSENAMFKLDQKQIRKALHVQTQGAPIVTFCNKQIVIMYSVTNKNDVAIENTCILLHGTTRPTIDYTTKLFKQISRCPFWEEKDATLKNGEECTITAIIKLDELKYNIASRIDFNVVLSFLLKEKYYLLPLDDVSISAKDVMGENFDILASSETDINNLLPSILATSERIDLCLRYIRHPKTAEEFIPMDIFCKYLKFEKLQNMENVAVNKNTHHTLYGVMIIVEDTEAGLDYITNVQVFSRSPSQVLALIYYMYDIIPYKIIATTKEYTLTAKVDQLSEYTEKLKSTVNYTECVLSIQNQIKMIQEYVNDCQAKALSETENEKIDKLDILTEGLPKYLDFRNKFLEEALNSIKTITFDVKNENNFNSDSDIIMLDE